MQSMSSLETTFQVMKFDYIVNKVKLSKTKLRIEIF